ncbi:MAG TPA: CapA family protein [Spirochaetota bacterium]|nr:CapA family protein [Spirochaetota bacterium]
MKRRIEFFGVLFFIFIFISLFCSSKSAIEYDYSKYMADDPVWETSANKIDLFHKEKLQAKKNWPKQEATITAVGDVALNFAFMEEVMAKVSSKYGKEAALKYPFKNVKNEFKGIVFCNLEAPITKNSIKAFPDKDEVFYFASPAGSEYILKQAGFNIASLANNHIKDCGDEGMFETAERLLSVNINPVGIGKNIDEALRPLYVWHRGVRIAFFAINNVIPKSVWATPFSPGAAGGSDELIISAIKRVKDEVDTVVVSIHWGEEVVVDFPIAVPQKEQVELGHKLIDAGVSCILGHQSHGIGKVELYKNGIIFYSLGDFVFAGRNSANHRVSIIARVNLSARGLESFSIIPVNINPLEVQYSPVILPEKKGRGVIDNILVDKESRYIDYYTSKANF